MWKFEHWDDVLIIWKKKKNKLISRKSKSPSFLMPMSDEAASSRYVFSLVMPGDLLYTRNNEDQCLWMLMRWWCCTFLLKGEEWTCESEVEIKNERPPQPPLYCSCSLEERRKERKHKKGFKWKINAMCTLSLLLFDNTILSPRINLQKYWHNNKRNIKDSTWTTLPSSCRLSRSIRPSSKSSLVSLCTRPLVARYYCASLIDVDLISVGPIAGLRSN